MFKPTTIRYWILFVRSWWHSFWQLIKFHLPVPSSCGIIFTSCEQVETSGVSHYADSKLEIWVQWVCWSGLSRRNGKKKIWWRRENRLQWCHTRLLAFPQEAMKPEWPIEMSHTKSWSQLVYSHNNQSDFRLPLGRGHDPRKVAHLHRRQFAENW